MTTGKRKKSRYKENSAIERLVNSPALGIILNNQIFHIEINLYAFFVTLLSNLKIWLIHILNLIVPLHNRACACFAYIIKIYTFVYYICTELVVMGSNHFI